MKGQGGLVSKSTLAALVQDSPPLTLHLLLYAFNLLAQSGTLSAEPPRAIRPPPTSPSTIYQPPRPDTVCMTHHYHHSCPLWVIYEYIPSHSGRTSQPVCCGCTTGTPAAWLGCLSVCCGCTACLRGSAVCLPVCCGCTPVGLSVCTAIYGVLLSLSAVVVLMHHDGSAVCLWLYSCILI